ncbi:MAG TPA: hypothetical protein VGF94_10125 [Kofleriaceae bacterium]|jgi:hypothetical protein
MKRVLALACTFACGGHGGGAGEPDAPAMRPTPDAPRPDAPAPDAASYRFLCQAPPPLDAPQPLGPPPPAAGCPALVAGTNTITSSGVTRTFQLVLPTTPRPGEAYPVMFMWYWLGGSSDGFITDGEVQAAVDDERYIAIVPNDIGAYVLGDTSFDVRWPFDVTQSPDRMNQEFTFFDDMLACVEQQYDINQSCVSTVGVSAGALFNDQLAQARSQTLSAFISLSGGVDDTIIKPWAGASRALPGIVLWGGDGPPVTQTKDILGCFGIGMDFSVASHDLEQSLVAGGNFFIECEHNCGHVEPPVDSPPGQSKFAGIWQFAFDHPFWLAPGASPYLTTGLPDTLPGWCGIGAGGATPRTGDCPPAENPCAY